MEQLQTKGDVIQYGDVLAGVGSVTLAGTTMRVHSYCVDGVMIDTGSKSLVQAMQPYFEQAQYDAVFLTHYHEDHTGNVDVLQNVPVYLHALSQPKAAYNERLPHYRALYWQQPPTFSAQIAPATFTSRQHTWDILHTPGHTDDHIALFNRNMGAVFTGDLFVTPKPRIVLMSENIIDTLASLKKVQALPFETMYCAHAGMLTNGHELLALKIDFIEQLIDRVETAHKEGYSFDEIVHLLLPKVPPMVTFSNKEWDASYIVRAILNR